MQPKVSIIIPVYNSERFLEKTIRSLLQQTYDNKEIIIIDDESKDNSYEIAKSFESPTVKVIRQKNGGAAVARNTGLANATGTYIQFMDADDFLSDDKIARQVAAISQYPLKVAVCDYIEFFDEKEIAANPNIKDQSSFIYSSDSPVDFLINLHGGKKYPDFIQTNSWLVPRAVIDRSGGWRNYRCPDDDGEFFTRVLLASEGIIHVPGIYNFYRRTVTEMTLSSNSNKKYVQNTLLTIDLKHHYLLQHSHSKAINKAIAALYFNFAVYQFPSYKILSMIAHKRYRLLGFKIATPKLGGRFIELINVLFGWRAARLVRYYLREKKIFSQFLVLSCLYI